MTARTLISDNGCISLLLILALTSCLGLLLTLYRRLFVSFPFANLSDNAGSCTLLLESSERAFERLVIFNSDFSHLFPSSLSAAAKNGTVLRRTGLPPAANRTRTPLCGRSLSAFTDAHDRHNTQELIAQTALFILHYKKAFVKRFFKKITKSRNFFL